MVPPMDSSGQSSSEFSSKLKVRERLCQIYSVKSLLLLRLFALDSTAATPS